MKFFSNLFTNFFIPKLARKILVAYSKGFFSKKEALILLIFSARPLIFRYDSCQKIRKNEGLLYDTHGKHLLADSHNSSVLYDCVREAGNELAHGLQHDGALTPEPIFMRVRAEEVVKLINALAEYLRAYDAPSDEDTDEDDDDVCFFAN